MAVDTRQKRMSMMAFSMPSVATMFEADGAVNLDDRQHLLWCYSGIAFAGGAPLTIGWLSPTVAQSRHFGVRES